MEQTLEIPEQQGAAGAVSLIKSMGAS